MNVDKMDMTNKINETVQAILNRLKIEDTSYDEKLFSIKVAFMFAEAGADAEQMEILTEAKKKVLAGLKEEKEGR